MFTARSKPYATRRDLCGMCGIEAATKYATRNGYCRDCIPRARSLGWAPPAETH